MATVWLSGFHGLGYGAGAAELNARHRAGVAGSVGVIADVRHEIDWGIYINADDEYSEFAPELEGVGPTLTVGAYFGLWDTAGADLVALFYLYDETEDLTQGTLFYDHANERLIYRRGWITDTVLWTGTTGGVPAGEGYFIELSVNFHNSTGTIIVKVDGTEVANLTSQDTINGSAFSGINYVGPAMDTSTGHGNAVIGFCAMYVNDDGTFLGPGRVRVVEVSADDTTDFTPLASTNVSQVDDGIEAADDDTSYNYSATVGHQDLFAVSGARPANANILAMQAVVRARATANDGRELAAQIDIGAGVVTGPPKGLDSPAWRGCHAITAPGSAYGSVAAAAAALNGSLVGYEIAT